MTYHRLGVQPVPGDNPQGSDVRYEDIFLDLVAEIEKMSSPSDRNDFSWKTVAALSSDVLEKHSKDLLAASYLSVALVHLNKGQGIDEATQILSDLFQNFWETLYPVKRRAAARISALEWWLEKTIAELEAEEAWTLRKDKVKTICDRLIAMDDFLEKNLEGSPSIKPLVSRIKNRTESKAQQLVAVEKPRSTQPLDITPMDHASFDSPDEAIKNLKPIFRSIRQTARLFREERDSNPQAYRWLRFSIWEPVRNLPPSIDHVTRIEAPAVQAINHLEHLLRDEDYTGLIHASESALANPRNMFLMDLNRFTWTALSRLGDKYRDAKDAVYFETKLFISRLKGFEDLAFSNGTPFVGQETKEWLLDQSQGRDNGSKSESGTVAANDLPHEKEVESIMEHYAASGSLKDAVMLFEQKIRSGNTKREATMYRLALARFLSQEKKESLAAAHLEMVMSDLDRHDLSSWDPALVLEVLTLLYRVYLKLPDRRKEHAGTVLGRIAKISTLEALTLKGL